MTAWIPLLAAAPPPEGQSGGLMSFLPFILIFAVFWFLVIGPARKKQKAHQEMVDNLKAGDKVVTNGGIHGTVVGVSKDIVQLRIAENPQIKIDMSRHAISGLRAGEE